MYWMYEHIRKGGAGAAIQRRAEAATSAGNHRNPLDSKKCRKSAQFRLTGRGTTVDK